MVTAGIFPFKENSHGRAGNQTRDIMISSQKLWPLDHDAAFLKLWSFLIFSSYLSVLPYGTTRLPLDGISWYMTFEYFSKICQENSTFINLLTPNDLYMSRTAPLTSKRCILYIYSTNVGTEYFKHALYFPFFSLQNAVCFIMLTSLVPGLFTFYIQSVLKLKKKETSGAKELNLTRITCTLHEVVCTFMTISRSYLTRMTNILRQ